MTFAAHAIPILTVVFCASLAQAQDRPAASPDDVAQWFDALDRHAPGVNDAALRAIADISTATFNQVRAKLAGRRNVESVEWFNRLVHRAALMHLDAAMLRTLSRPENPPQDSPRASVHSRSRPTAILTTDGGYSGVEATEVHWGFGRMLIDLTAPRVDDDPWALQWYVASSAFMTNRSLLADLTPHLDKARKLFPTDPDILFASGCYFETISSPRVRPILDSTMLPFGMHINAPSERESLRTAEDYFRRAVEARPDFAAARLRRGRALDRLGRHAEAVQELRRAVSLTAEPAMQYLAVLFEGAAQEALGDASAAQALYEQAARQFPNAQSPYLTLSRLARDRGDRTAAQAAAERVFTRDATDEMHDPWWTYHLFIIRNVPAMMQALQRPFTETGATPAGRK
jgi:tetratricopeptide (TPR) repeat protein